ncbi:MAG: gephyrin-like molybdotransferase Glp [Flavobacteriaceae bacterium]
MIAVEEALGFIRKEKAEILETEFIATSHALGRVLSTPLVAPLNLPSFRQSAMDGYALCISEKNTYKVVGEIKAGDETNFLLKKGECVRIFTGAPVPDTAQAVVIQEKVTLKENNITIDSPLKKGQNIREIGSQVQKGNVTLEKNQELNPAGLGFIQSLGIQSVEVYRKPKVTVVVTGNELVAPGSPLSKGKIFESNSLLLDAALSQFQVKAVVLSKVKDTLQSTIVALEKAIAHSDLVLISGGISVGKYDFVGEALAQLGVKEVFYKVKQRPGKPLFFGKKERTFCFALPGNPASTLSCFYVYVLPLLNRMMHKNSQGLRRSQLPLTHSFHSSEPRALFLKAFVKEGKVTILDHQNSSMLISFAKANALVYLPENEATLEKEDFVTVLFLPEANQIVSE